VLADLRFAFRQLAKAPVLSLVIILSLAAGIGANTVVFSWIEAVFLDPLPGVAHGARFLTIQPRDRSGTYLSSSWLDYRDIREQQTTFREIAAVRFRALNLGGADGQDERLWAELVSDNYFALLGLRPALGRFFTPEESTRPGAGPVAMISYAFWQTRFGGSPAVLGKTVRLNDVVFTIVGVAPEKFKGSIVGLGFDLWLPFTMVREIVPTAKDLTGRGNRPLLLLADLKPGVTPRQAGADLEAIFQRLARTYPDTNAGVSCELTPLWRSPQGAQRMMIGALGTLQVLVSLVLLVVCANTANLLLARATIRQKEIGIRLAIGAGRGRILRQLLTESVVLALLGAAGGVLLSLWGIDALYHVPVPRNLPIKMTAHLDGTGLAFSVLVGAACGLVFGLAPALQLARGDVAAALKAGGRGSGAAGHHRLRDLLVVIEVALALVVLVLAGLFLKSFGNTRTVDPGFQPNGVLLANFDLAAKGYTKDSARAFVRELLSRLRAEPGVEAAAISNFVPLDLRGMSSDRLEVDGRPRESDRPGRTFYGNVDPGYFQTLGIPLVAGVGFTGLDQDRTAKAPEVIINQELARRYWPGLSPLGHKLTLDGESYEVVGVVRDGKYATLSETQSPMAYFSIRDRFSFSNLTLHVRAKGDPVALVPPVRRVFHELNPALPIRDVRTMVQHIDDNLVMLRVPARLLSVLGPLALLLAAIGIYSVLSYSVAQRTHEIGVRLTLGATPRNVVAMIVGQGLRVVAGGLAAGLVAAFVCSLHLSTVLVKVPAGDPLVFLSIPVLLLGVAVLATWLPARRAARVDPIIALRAE
jgi:predicted permease